MKTIEKILACAVTLLLLVSVAAYSQKPATGTNTGIERVKACDTLWYYGLDLSHVRVTDGAKIPRSLNYSTVYPPAWVGFVEKELSPYQYVQPALGKKMFNYVSDEVQHNTQQVVKDFIIGVNYSFPADTVARAVKSYKLSQLKGVGLVIIAENFNKNTESSTTWITFFDIHTREILWATKASGECRHMGYTAHWGSGIVTGFKNFISSANF
jgi:hypothetical protein